MTTDELRAKFVAHFSQPPYEWDFTLLHDGSGWLGSYDKYYVQCAWEAWQAAHASRDAEVEALIRKYEKRSMYEDGGLYSNIIDDLQELLGK